MRVLVTGAAGRVGTNMVKRLVDEGATVRAMVLPGDAQRSKLDVFPDVEVVEADLGDQAAIDVACRGVTHVVHLAAQLVRGDTPVDRLYDVNALGTLRLLEGVVHGGAEVERFVLASSDGTYRPGRPPARPLREDSWQEPADYYGTSKLLGEVILRNHSAQFALPYSIVRFATVISPEEAGTLFRLRFWRALLGWQALGKNSHLWPLFDGQPDLLALLNEQAGEADDDIAVGLRDQDLRPWTLSLLDVRDAVEGVYRALTEPGAVGQAFNLAAREPTSHDDGAATIADLYDVPKLMITMPTSHRLELSIDSAIERVGFWPRHDFRSTVQDGLRGTRDFIEAHSSSGIASTW
ncbi:NAD-dependent epimerase/dehydratase family protein [Jiangella alkaliphila]|uniref:UDP-glucose 4-epimerase n=1 Tax=Jiangella alkaliphila TaxID=419479 RepID=A0A1H2K558_9ACTN|nr:NAD(P)-dependent oxidoreductase [Jiangella alkaliphila]SDU63486.1 UDP-glucose 4-epimerase [Jiangella alkaliphila]